MPSLRLMSLFLLAFCAGPVHAEWRSLPYADLAKMPLMLKKVDPEGIYRAYYQAKPAKGQATLPADLKMQVSTGGQVVPVPIQTDGRVDLPIRQDWSDAGAQVQVNQPKGTISVSFIMNSRTPPGTRMTYGQLTESVPVLERGIKEMAGMLSLFAPKVKQVVLKFEKGTPQTATLALPDGKKKAWKTNVEGQIQLPWEPDWSPGIVVLSAPLKGIDQVMK